jgi:hypothetical protein
MSRSRSPSPYKGNYRRRRSRSTSPTVLTKEEQLKKIADITISNVGRRRDYNDVFGDEKDFWTSIQSEKRGDTNFDLEKAKTWWLKTNQTLPTKETARNILGNLIISTNTFNKIKKSCIDVICRDHLEEEVPDKWDDTLLKCTIAANIDDFQTSGIPTVSHYYMTNSPHQYSDKPSSRCTTPVIPPDNNPVIVVHSCTLEKIEKEKNKSSYRYYPHEPHRTSAFIMTHINDITRKKPTDYEMTTAFQAFKEDFHQIHSRLHSKMEYLKNYEINEKRWPINVKSHFQTLKNKLERQINLVESLQEETQPSDYNAKTNQIRMMDAIYHVIQEQMLWQMDNSHILKDLIWRFPIDKTISCCEAKIMRAQNEINQLNTIINSYKQNVEHADNSSRIIKDVQENSALKVRIVKQLAIKYFNLEQQLPSIEFIPAEEEEATQSDKTITELKLQEKIEKLVKNVTEEDDKCFYTKATYCPCGKCKNNEDKSRCIIHNCSCLYHSAKSLKATAKTFTNKYQAYTTATTFNALMMGTTKAPRRVTHSIVRQYLDDPDASTIKPKRIHPQSATIDDVRIDRARVASTTTTATSTSSDEEVPDLEETTDFELEEKINFTPSARVDWEILFSPWEKYLCQTEKHEAVKAAFRERNLGLPETTMPGTTCARFCHCKNCESTCKCGLNKERNHLEPNERLQHGHIGNSDIDKHDERQIRKEKNLQTVSPSLIRTHKVPCRKQYIEDLKKAMRIEIQHHTHFDQFAMEDTTCSAYCRCPECQSTCTCPNDHVRVKRHSAHQQDIFIEKENDYEYWTKVHLEIIEEGTSHRQEQLQYDSEFMKNKLSQRIKG